MARLRSARANRFEAAKRLKDVRREHAAYEAALVRVESELRTADQTVLLTAYKLRTMQARAESIMATALYYATAGAIADEEVVDLQARLHNQSPALADGIARAQAKIEVAQAKLLRRSAK